MPGALWKRPADHLVMERCVRILLYSKTLTKLVLHGGVALLFFAIEPREAHSQSIEIPAYVGSEVCRECHEEEADQWNLSHHAKAWTLPSAETVVADFSGTQFTHPEMTASFHLKDGQYTIETEGPDGALIEYPVAGVAGIAPLQQYLLETAPGQLQAFDVAWDDLQKQWYHLYPDQDLPVGNGLHWTGPYKNWNARCAECHATGFKKNYDSATRSYASVQAEIGVGCEACHGPGEAHRDWALANGSYDRSKWPAISETGFTMEFGVSAEADIQQCAGCHSRREPYADGNPLPGTAFHDAYRLAKLRPGLYHPDGQILDEVYVYGSFLQSKMYEKGVSCTNCHNAHTGEQLIAGNGVCTQCHSPVGNPDFPSLPLAEFDDPSHHFHPEGSDGAQCKNCHMIEREYMVIDGRRDHSFRVPRPDLSAKTRVPSACNDCHDDKSAKWAAEIVADWFPDSTHRSPHFSQVFALAWGSPDSEVDGLIGIVEHTGLPAIVRASALDLLAQVSTPQIATRMEPALSDADPVVRAAAISVQLGAAPTDIAARVANLLADPARDVRIAAARAFLGLPIARMPTRITDNLNRSMTDWESSLIAKADFPESQLVIAGIGLTTRRWDAALAAFGDAVEMDPQLEQAWSMIVRIHEALGNRKEALASIDAAIAVNPESIPLFLLKADLAE